MVASITIHGLVMVSLWSDLPQSIGDARYADVIVEILPDEMEHSVPKHPIKAAIALGKTHSHPEASSSVKKRLNPAYPHWSTPNLPSSGIANRPVKTSRPAQTVALAASISAASDPTISRQVQRKEQEGSRDAVRKRLETFKYYPASARRRGIEGDVDVAFKLVHGGVAEQVEVLKGSGYAVLDHAALTTVARAQPFPVGNGVFRFHLRFRRL